MKKYILTCFVLCVLSACSSDEPPTPIDGAAIPSPPSNQMNTASGVLPLPLPKETGVDASGQAVSYGTPGAVSTQVPESMKMLKQEYTDSTGKKATFEGAILLAENGTIKEIQVLNPSWDGEYFVKNITKEIVGKSARNLKIETIDDFEGIIDAFNISLANAMK